MVGCEAAMVPLALVDEQELSIRYVLGGDIQWKLNFGRIMKNTFGLGIKST